MKFSKLNFNLVLCVIIKLVLFSKASHIEEVSTFIIGGSASSTGSDPWIVHLNFYQSGQLFCGGVIIGEDWVLSAAHCYQPRETFYVVAGDYNQNVKEKFETNLEVERILVHPLYNVENHQFDVMMIKLKKKFDWSSSVQPIKISDNTLVEGQNCRVCGWGNTKITTDLAKYPKRLRCVQVPQVSTQTCNILYSGQIQNDMFCLGQGNVGGSDACDGDSGSPAVCDGKLYGLVSWGYGCGNPNFPGVYVKLQACQKWIDSVIKFYR